MREAFISPVATVLISSTSDKGPHGRVRWTVRSNAAVSELLTVQEATCSRACASLGDVRTLAADWR